MPRQIRPLGALAVVAALSIVPLTAWGQAGRFNIQQFHPMPSQWSNFLNLSSGRVLPHLDYEVGVIGNYADDPLVLNDEADERVASLVGSQLTLNLLGAVGIIDRLELAFDLPLIVSQDGEVVERFPGGDASGASFSVGDLRIVPKATLFTQADADDPSGISLALLANTWIPTGDEDNFQGEGFRMEPRVAVDYTFPAMHRIGLNIGYLARPESSLANVDVDDALTFGLAGVVAITEKIHVVPEVNGQTPVANDTIAAEEVPLEGLLALRFKPLYGLVAEAGASTGFVDGYGSPDWRIFLGATYSSVQPPDPDWDDDGYLNEVDGCPYDPEDFDQWEDEDGCPDPDNDGDSILDVADGCPNDPEDFDDWEDEDGCPDPDNDQDTYPDVADGCPNDPEDFDQWEDEDGCPDPDNDGDGYADAEDGCPNEPESWNDYQDEDGCYDERLVEIVVCDRIEIGDRVYFDTDSDVIQERSYPLLDSIVRMLQNRPDIHRVSIEGHTDSRNTEEYNLDLSERRAQSVRNYMIEHDIAPDRLESHGYGESLPIDTNRTAEGRQNNRRVEFLILGQENCEPVQPTPLPTD